METIGKYEFNRKDLIGHGAFAVVFKGRHKDKRDLEVAVKCINKKSLSKSQALLGKEIKILKELQHENIVGLLDYQEMGGCVYLVMEYCNGGDLAEYLHSKGTLSEDTIRGFLQQMGLAMKVLQSKGILHRDLKPQNILLCHPEGRRSSPNNICIKLADFGFARHLQTNTMAVTLCGSPMYMAPEVIMSQNYDAKADLWSIGTIVYQCLTGKAPFHASTPQELRLFYESNLNLLPSIPRGTSSHLRHLLLGLLQRNHAERMNFDDFFHHPFLESSSSTKKSSPAPMHTYPSCGLGSSSGSSTASQLASPQHSDGEMHRLQHKARDSPTQDATCFLEKVADIQDSSNAALYTDDYVMVPAQFPSDYACEMGDGSPLEDSLIYDGCGSLGAERALSQAGRTPPSSPLTCSPSRHASGSNYSQSVPIPVPTQIQNFQRMKQNLQVAGLHDSIRPTLCAGAGSTRSESSPSYILGTASGLPSPRLSAGGAQPQPSSPLVGHSPRISEPTKPLCTRTGLLDGSGIQRSPSSRQKLQIRNPQSISPGSSCPKQDQLSCYGQIRTAPGFHPHGLSPDSKANQTSNEDNRNGPFKRRLSTGRLSDMLLKAAFGAQLFLEENEENLISEKGTDPAAPPSGSHRAPGASSSPNTVGSLSRDNTPPNTTAARVPGSPSHNMNTAGLVSSHLRAGVRRASQSECMDASPHGGVVFHPPELPVDTLMEQPHTDALSELCFTLAFVNCVMEIASSKDPALDASINPDVSFLQQSLVADQISLLSREWSYSEQLVLYMKAEEFLSSALHTAKENIKQGKLLPSATAKQVIRKLNELYKNCVTYCRSLNGRLQSFLLDKQRLMDRFSSITAEKLIYCHTVHMVQSAALDEMFHDGTESIQRYRKALLLMEGLSRIVTEQQDQDGIDKCKECIDRRLASLHSVKCL